MTFLAPFRAPFQNPFPKEGGAAAATYAEILRDTYGASEIWPLVDISSGTTISAFVDSARNGTLTGWDLQNAAGPVSGTLAPYSDGANDKGDIFTASYDSLFSLSSFSIFGFAKADASIWTDGTIRFIFFLGFDAISQISLSRTTTDYQLRFLRRDSTGYHRLFYSYSNINWFSYGISWDSDNLKFYVDGNQVGTTINGLGTWSDSNKWAVLGATYGTGITSVFNGNLAYFSIKAGLWSDADFSNMHAAAATAGAD